MPLRVQQKVIHLPEEVGPLPPPSPDRAGPPPVTMAQLYHPGQPTMTCAAYGGPCALCAAGHRHWSCCGRAGGSPRGAAGCEVVPARTRGVVASADCGWGPAYIPRVEGRWVSSRHGLLSIRQHGASFSVVCPDAKWSPAPGTLGRDGAVRLLGTIAVLVPGETVPVGERPPPRRRSDDEPVHNNDAPSPVARGNPDKREGMRPPSPSSGNAGSASAGREGGGFGRRRFQHHTHLPHPYVGGSDERSTTTFEVSESTAPPQRQGRGERGRGVLHSGDQPRVGRDHRERHSHDHSNATAAHGMSKSEGVDADAYPRHMDVLSRLLGPAEGGAAQPSPQAGTQDLRQPDAFSCLSQETPDVAVGAPAAAAAGAADAHGSGLTATLDRVAPLPPPPPPVEWSAVLTKVKEARARGSGDAAAHRRSLQTTGAEHARLGQALLMSCSTLDSDELGLAGPRAVDVEEEEERVVPMGEDHTTGDTHTTYAAAPTATFPKDEDEHDRTRPAQSDAEEGDTHDAVVAAAAQAHLRVVLVDMYFRMMAACAASSSGWDASALLTTRKASLVSEISSQGLGGGSGYGFAAPFLKDGVGVPLTAAAAAARFAAGQQQAEDARESSRNPPRVLTTASGTDVCGAVRRISFGQTVEVDGSDASSARQLAHHLKRASSELSEESLPSIAREQIEYLSRNFAMQPAVLRIVVCGLFRRDAEDAGEAWNDAANDCGRSTGHASRATERSSSIMSPIIDLALDEHAAWLAGNGVVEPSRTVLKFQDGDTWSRIGGIDPAAERIREILCEFFVKNGELAQLKEVDVLVDAFQGDEDALYARLHDVYDGDRKAVELLDRLLDRLEVSWNCTRCHHVLNSKRFNTCAVCGSDMRSASRPYFIPPKARAEENLPAFCFTKAKSKQQWSRAASLLRSHGRAPNDMLQSASGGDGGGDPRRAYDDGIGATYADRQRWMQRAKDLQGRKDRKAQADRALLALGFVASDLDVTIGDANTSSERILYSPQPGAGRRVSSMVVDRDQLPNYEKVRTPRQGVSRYGTLLSVDSSHVTAGNNTMLSMTDLQAAGTENGSALTPHSHTILKGDTIIYSVKGTPHRGEVIEVFEPTDDQGVSYMVRLPNGAVVNVEASELGYPDDRTQGRNRAQELDLPPWHPVAERLQREEGDTICEPVLSR